MLDIVPKSLDTEESTRTALLPWMNPNHSLMMACTGKPVRGDDLEIMRLLLKCMEAQDVNKQNSFGDTPLHYAISKFDPSLTSKVRQDELADKAN